MIDVQPVSGGIIVYATIEIYKLELSKPGVDGKLTGVVRGFDQSERQLKFWEFSITGEQYSSWTDDLELQKLILSGVGLEPKDQPSEL